MDLFEEFIGNIWVMRTFWSIITILVSVLIYSIVARIVDAREKKKTKSPLHKKGRTFAKMFKSIIRYVLIILDVLIILQIFGVDVSSTLAGVGIIGIVVAFAVQDALKDIIRGFDIISDNYYAVGDIVKIGENTGKVLSVGLKTTKLQDIYTLNNVSISNRNIDKVEVISDAAYLTIPLSYDLPVKKAEEILSQALKNVEKNPEVISTKFFGLNQLSDSSMDYLVEVKCDPTIKSRVRRAALQAIVATLEDNKISIPYPQLDVHTKK